MAQGPIFSFSDTTTTKRAIANIIHNIDPQDTPCVSYFGLANQSKFKLLNFPNHKYEWLKDTLRVRTTHINNGGGYPLGTETSMVVDDASLFKPGDVVLIGKEKIWIGAVDVSTNTISSLVRGWGSTSGAAIADNAEVTYLFSARLEGDDSDDSPFTVPTTDYNYSQILHWEIEITGSEQDATTRYGISDAYKYQLMKALGGMGGGRGQRGRAGDLMIDLEKTFFFGERIQRTSGTAGAMGGVKQFVTPTDLNGESFELEHLEDAMQRVWERGGMPNVLVCNANQKRRINTWFAGHVRTERSERTGGVLINQIDTDFGSIDILMNRHCPSDEVYILDRQYVGWLTLRDWFVETLGKTGDARRDQIVGEFGFAVTCPEANEVLTGLAV